ncbi:hypothetical protein IG631_21957 [Alternaria alternata]|nr:hypothetical protein IG631_21957 [Alternaria alternata]
MAEWEDMSGRVAEKRNRAAHYRQQAEGLRQRLQKDEKITSPCQWRVCNVLIRLPQVLLRVDAPQRCCRLLRCRNHRYRPRKSEPLMKIPTIALE